MLYLQLRFGEKTDLMLLLTELLTILTTLKPNFKLLTKSFPVFNDNKRKNKQTKTKTKINKMNATELTPHQRIEILEDVLKKLKSGDPDGGLCVKIENSAFELFRVCDYAKNIIPIFTFENARKVTEIEEVAKKVYFWWDYGFYDFENRIKFVKWMIEQEKSFLK